MRRKWCLTHEDVLALAHACRSLALERQLSVTIAIVDDGGYLLHIERLDPHSGADLT